MKKYYLLVLFLITFYSSCFSQTKSLSHNDFPVKDFIVFLDSSTINKLSKIELMNGDSPLDYVKYVPNYSTFYEIVEWSCGSPCKQVVIIDLRNGKVIGSLNYCYNLDFNLSKYFNNCR